MSKGVEAFLRQVGSRSRGNVSTRHLPPFACSVPAANAYNDLLTCCIVSRPLSLYLSLMKPLEFSIMAW